MRRLRMGIITPEAASTVLCPGSIVEQHWHLAVFGDLQFLFEFFTQVGGIDHGRVFVDSVGDFFLGQPCSRNAIGWASSSILPMPICKLRKPRSRSRPGRASSPTLASIRSWGTIRLWRR